MIPTEIGEHMFVDTITLPKSGSGMRHVFIMMCFLSRAVWWKCTAVATALAFAEWIVYEYIPRHGCPKVLTSDRGSL